VRLACWYAAWAAGLASLDDARDHVLGDDAAHDVLGLSDDPVALVLAFGRLRARAAPTAVPAVPAPGEPAGLGGPPAFNAEAIEAGEAVLLPGSGLGLVPTVVGAGVTWRVLAAEAPPPAADVAEAELLLRETLLECSARLADLDVARWRPEAAQGLHALRTAGAAPLAPGFDARSQRVAALALRCLAVAEHALGDDSDSVTSYTVSAYAAAERRAALATLSRAARRALVAACSVPPRQH